MADAAPESASRYDRRGVSYSKKDVHSAIEKVDKGLFPGAFCKVIPDFLGGDPAYCNIVHADGAGTKSSLAYLYWRETGDMSVWRGIAQDAIVMNIDDLICAGVTDGILLSSTIGRNKARIGGEVIKALIEGNEEIIAWYASMGIKMVNCGGETADVGDLVRTVIVDSTVTARCPRSQIVDAAHMKPGQLIVGLASHGQASYESEYNAGMGSNGLTSARHDVFHARYRAQYPESYAPEVAADLVYSGPYALTDRVPQLPVDMGKAVLSPTRTYAPVVRDILASCRSAIGGIIHVSGGAHTKIAKFGHNLHFIKDKPLPIAPLFELIQQASGTPWSEMYAVFNMGTRLEVVCDEKAADQVIAIATSYGIHAQVCGRLEASPQGNRVSLHSPHGLFSY